MVVNMDPVYNHVLYRECQGADLVRIREQTKEAHIAKHQLPPQQLAVPLLALFEKP